MTRDTLRISAIIAVTMILLTLTGIFSSFQNRYVIANVLPLNTVLLVMMIGGAGYFTAGRAYVRGLRATILSGVAGSMILCVALALLTLLENSVDMRFVFPNLADPSNRVLTFGLEIGPGLVVLLGVGIILGVAAGISYFMPRRQREAILLAVGLTVVAGLLEEQIHSIMALPDALALASAFGLGYAASIRLSNRRMLVRAIVGLVAGAIWGTLLALLANIGGLNDGGLLRGTGSAPMILGLNVLLMEVIFGIVGTVAAVVSSAPKLIHNGAIYFVAGLLVIGVTNWRGDMDILAAALTLLVVGLAIWFTSATSAQSAGQFETLSRGERRTTNRIAALAALGILIVAPLFLGQYIANVFDLMGLYILMGIGLNVVIGYAGLLDLGYVAFFAIGAYTIGLLTAPSILTCGGLAPRDLDPQQISQTCTGIMTFWEAWPMAVLVSGLAGVLLGIPVLRLRGDYLAIVTLGFGEIINRLVNADPLKNLLGAAQGISPIPNPVIDLTSLNPAWRFELNSAPTMYYLILLAVLVAGAVAIGVANTRLGRAWRAMRADEDVAQAAGVNLVQTKLLAFAIGAAFAGMGGALFAALLRGVFPNSFTLLVSLNVLSLIIIGGLGSIPGVIVGALMLIALPEVLRELQDYRLLAFGVVLVVAMLSRPQGLIPPPVRRLTELHRTE